jgi:ABC-type Zn uptake system ZnuABC Zn-binding protein ZnuA
MVNTIKNSLINTFESDKEIIEKNYNEYYNKLNELNTKFEQQLLKLKDSTIIVGHEAFNYFSKDYNINTKPLLGLHEEEPSAKALTEIKKYIQDNNITKIFGEHFEENESIEKVAKDCNISVSYLYTCEMMNNSNLSYIECQEENLKTLIK